MENDEPRVDLIITEEGLLKKELQDEIEARLFATVENLFTLDVELESFVQLVKESVEDNKDSPENLEALLNYLDEMWGVVITNELRDVLVNSLCVIQKNKDELEDIIDELTSGRGGEFYSENNKFIYQPSGFEPEIFLYSRTGIPLSARAINQKSVSSQYKPLFMTFEAINSAKKHNLQLDFEQQVMPLLQTELSYVYYFTLINNQYDAATAERFSSAYINAGSASMREAIVNEFIAADSRFSLDKLLNPVPQHLNQAEFTTWLDKYLIEDMQNALEGNIDNPLKAACDVLRDIRDVIRSAVDFGGLTPASHKKFINQFVPIMNRLAVGPPKARVHEWVALKEAGILHFNSGQSPICELNAGEAKFTLTATAFRAPVVKGDVLIKAKVEMPGPLESESLLMQRLIQRKIVRPFRNGDYHPGGIEVSQQLNIVSAQGEVIKNIWALGILTEGCKFYTFVVPRPGVNSTAIIDAGRAVKQMMENIFHEELYHVA